MYQFLYSATYTVREASMTIYTNLLTVWLWQGKGVLSSPAVTAVLIFSLIFVIVRIVVNSGLGRQLKTYHRYDSNYWI